MYDLFTCIKLIALVMFWLTTAYNANSQVSELVSSGGVIVSGEYAIGASVGQSFINDKWTGKYYLSEGFQQHHKIVVIKDDSDVLFNVYPNPTHEVLYIKCVYPLAVLNVYDTQGSLVRSVRDIGQPYFQLSVLDFVSAKYFIEMIDDEGGISVQQIIKQ